MEDNQLIKYENGQLEKVKNLIAITDKVLEPTNTMKAKELNELLSKTTPEVRKKVIHHLATKIVLDRMKAQDPDQMSRDKLQRQANLTILVAKMAAIKKQEMEARRLKESKLKESGDLNDFVGSK